MRRKLHVLIIAGLLPLTVCAQEYARILSQATTYTVVSEDEAIIEEVHRVQINSEKGKRFAVFYAATDKFTKLDEVAIDIFDPQGKRVDRLKRADGHEFGFNASYEITDAKIFVIDPKYQNYPFVVEMRSKMKLNGYLSLPAWVPRGSFNLAVDKATLTIRRPVNLDPFLKEEFVKAAVTQEGATKVSTYEVANLPAVEKKLRFKDFYESEAKVLVSPKTFKLDESQGSFASWSDFGEWFLLLNSDPYELDQRTKDIIGTLDKSDSREVIKRLYQYMQDRVRYVSIQLGIGGFKSLPTADVEKYGYGDCKALTTYMKNMLHHAGIASNYILVRAGNDVPDVKADFPSNQFNHVFLGIPMAKDTMYLECTSQTSPTNYTGTFTDDRNVLWIAAKKSKIIHSRIYDHTQNVRKSTLSIQLTPEGDATLSQTQVNEGVFYDELMLYQNAPESYVKEHNHEKFTYGDFTIKAFNYSNPDRNTPRFQSNFGLEVNGLAKKVGDKLVIPIVPTAPVKRFAEGDDMMHYYAVKRGLTVQDEIEIALPKNYWIYNLPEKAELSTRFGSYKLETIFDGSSKLTVRRTIILYRGDYVQKEFEEFKSFMQQMERLEARKLVLNSKT